MTSAQFSLDSEHAKRLIAMGQMAASLAHEIRNPLGSMELFCTLLKKDLAQLPESLKLAEQIHVSIRTVNQIIANCLQFAREISVQRKRQPSVKRFLDDALSQVEELRLRNRAEISLSVVRDGEALFDSYLIKQALINLVSNAIEATAEIEGSREVTIDCCVEPTGSWWVSVADNGIGVADADKEKIFDPFYTTKAHGTGLGLAIVHSIVSAHGAHLTVESEQGTGTMVRLQFPAQNEMQKEQISCRTDQAFS